MWNSPRRASRGQNPFLGRALNRQPSDSGPFDHDRSHRRTSGSPAAEDGLLTRIPAAQKSGIRHRGGPSCRAIAMPVRGSKPGSGTPLAFLWRAIRDPAPEGRFVTTPSAKADGFSVKSWGNPIALRAKAVSRAKTASDPDTFCRCYPTPPNGPAGHFIISFELQGGALPLSGSSRQSPRRNI